LNASGVLMSGLGVPDLTALHEVVELLECERRHVAARAFIDHPIEIGAGLEADIDLVPARLLERSSKLLHAGFSRLVEIDGDLGRLRCANRCTEQRQHGDRCHHQCFHMFLPMFVSWAHVA
jgi:hypothetical protein